MSADVAVQGIAQDYITFFLAVPALLITLIAARRGSRQGKLRSRLLLSGITGYFFVSYLFYLVMGMYNPLFLLYVVLLCCSFFALAFQLTGLWKEITTESFKGSFPAGFIGGFLIFNASIIALLWLSVILPPLFDGTLYPPGLDHYTTMIVQGLDLGLLLPLCFYTGLILRKRRAAGYLLGITYLGFLSLLMTALTAKLIGMGMVGATIVPAIFIIPVILAFTLFSLVRALMEVKEA